jgi:hypothetical protein
MFLVKRSLLGRLLRRPEAARITTMKESPIDEHTRTLLRQCHADFARETSERSLSNQEFMIKRASYRPLLFFFQSRSHSSAACFPCSSSIASRVMRAAKPFAHSG